MIWVLYYKGNFAHPVRIVSNTIISLRCQVEGQKDSPIIESAVLEGWDGDTGEIQTRWPLYTCCGNEAERLEQFMNLTDYLINGHVPMSDGKPFCVDRVPSTDEYIENHNKGIWGDCDSYVGKVFS